MCFVVHSSFVFGGYSIVVLELLQNDITVCIFPGKKGFTFLRFKDPEIKVHSVVINNECPSTVRALNENRID